MEMGTTLPFYGCHGSEVCLVGYKCGVVSNQKSNQKLRGECSNLGQLDPALVDNPFQVASVLPRGVTREVQEGAECCRC